MAKTRSTPLPIQAPLFREDDFKPEHGYQFINQWATQVARTLNKLQGSVGPSVLPSGIDVAGGTVTGLGTPQGPSDAVSSGHAESNYGAPTIGPQLDVGGKNALSGLTSIYLNMTQAYTGTIIIPKLTTANGSITVVNGLIVSVVQPT
jgi:hypothetical protein